MKKRISVKVLSFMLCLAMLLPMATMLPFTAAAASGSEGSDYSSATSTETVVVDGVYYYIQRSVAYTGNSTYSLNIRIHTSLSETETPLFRTSAENGYFTVQTTGYYLLELWGGSGAAGRDDASKPAGQGGAAGYVYAQVWLEKGQTLAYSIGTNGALSNRVENGGGENGTGGGHGATGRFEVGGGGGGASANCTNINSNGKPELPGKNALTTTVVVTEFEGDVNQFKGASGNSGNAYIADTGILGDGYGGTRSGTEAAAGDAGKVYINPALLNVGNSADETIYMKRLAEAMVKQNGVQTASGTEISAAQITYICSSETTELLNAFPGVQSTGKFTKYFEVAEDQNGYIVDMTISGRTYDQREVEQSDGIVTVTYYKAE